MQYLSIHAKLTSSFCTNFSLFQPENAVNLRTQKGSFLTRRKNRNIKKFVGLFIFFFYETPLGLKYIL